MTREEILQIAKPILFNTDMMVAVLENRKGVTRRVAKHIIPFDDNGEYFNIFRKGEWTGPVPKALAVEMKAPYRKGDYLYVRETWSEWTGGYLYKAWPGPFAQPGESAVMKWHPSIHMPKEAARIFLKVTDVRVERLQDMESSNDEQYHAEGAKDKHDFIRIWNSTIDPAEIEKYGWYANPWVWVIEFERVEVQG